MKLDMIFFARTRSIPASCKRVKNLVLQLFVVGLLVLGAPGQTADLPGEHSILFNRISANDGISHAAVRKIMQDSQGFIWIGTQQGLNRFDGYEFEIFNYFPDDPDSLSNDWIYDIFEDDRGRIWVATDSGLNLFEPKSRTFSHFRHEPDNPSSLPHDSVRTIFQSEDGKIWVGTRRGLSRLEGDNLFTHFIIYQPTPGVQTRPGVRAIAQGQDGRLWLGSQHESLAVLDPGSGELEEIELRPHQRNTVDSSHVRSLIIDDRGVVWAGTHAGGIFRIHPATGEIEHLTSDGGRDSLSSNQVRKIYQDDESNIWVATEGGGLNLWHEDRKGFSQYRHDPVNPFSLSDDVVYEVMQDGGGVIWVGTFNGISKWNARIPTFSHIRRSDSGKHSLSNNKISSFAESRDGSLWIGTIGGGVNRWDSATNSFQSFLHDDDNPASLVDDVVMSLLQDSEGRLWAGTMGLGVSRMAGTSGEFEHFRFDPDDETSISSDSVSSMLQDNEGRIWIATYGGGLNRYLGQGRFARYAHDSGDAYELSRNFLVDLEEGRDGSLWLASDGGGLIRFDPETGAARALVHDEDNQNTISGDHIISLLQTSTALWVGTRDSGLNRFADGRWEHFNKKGGLVSNAIYGILEDDSQRIWISHGKGLSRFDPATGGFTNYTTIHGLQGNDFNNGASLRTSDGKLLFGGTNGFNIFSPEQIRGNRFVPPIQLTRFTKFNREFQFDVPTYELDHIALSHSDSVVGFEFAALDFTDPRKNQYRYKLEGFDREWVMTTGVRQATYTNLDAGNYVLHVQGSNNDGIWNTDGLVIGVDVAPPLWATWWAWILYALLLLAMVYAATRAYSARLHRVEQERHNRQLAGLVAERTSALEIEINDHKAARTELSNSLREKEVLLKEVHHRVKNNMQVISSLLNIQADSVAEERFVNLLTESQQRIKSMALIHENLYRSESLLEIDFHQYIDMLANSLLRFYRFNKLVVQLKVEVENILLDIDTAVPCGLIINELVSNALKHAYVGRTGKGLITVGFELINEGRDYCFYVADDGVGLEGEMNPEKSTSMGLEIVRILTEQLDGELTVTGGDGTEFRIVFPRKKR